MTTTLAIALLLFIAALVVFAIDLMIPTGGVLIAVTGILAFAAVVFAFRHSPTSGLWMLCATLCAMPIGLWVFVVVWPKTPMGRRMVSAPPPPGEFVWSDAARTDAKSLVGAVGVAETEMLPHGSIRIGDKSYEGFSEAGPIDAGQNVRVVRIDIGRLAVVQVREPQVSDEPLSAGSGLDQPISELNLDSLDD